MAFNTIKLKNHIDVNEEYTAAGAITPGHLCTLDSNGKVIVHAVSGGPVLIMFATEDELQGGAIDTAYASTNKVNCWFPTRGDVVYALLLDGENVAIGDFLDSSGAGTLKKAVNLTSAAVAEYPANLVGRALEAVNLNQSSDPSARIKVQII